MHEWPDGDHCIYNHSHEKHTLVADWFTDRLTAQAAGHDHARSVLPTLADPDTNAHLATTGGTP